MPLIVERRRPPKTTLLWRISKRWYTIRPSLGRTSWRDAWPYLCWMLCVNSTKEPCNHPVSRPTFPSPKQLLPKPLVLAVYTPPSPYPINKGAFRRLLSIWISHHRSIRLNFSVSFVSLVVLRFATSIFGCSDAIELAITIIRIVVSHTRSTFVRITFHFLMHTKQKKNLRSNWKKNLQKYINWKPTKRQSNEMFY